MLPKMLPPLMCDDGSTGMTATRFFFFTNFIPNFSINVDFPAPRLNKLCVLFVCLFYS